MKKVSLQFKSRRQLLLFLDYIGSTLCIIDVLNRTILCELSEKMLSVVTKKYRAKIVGEPLLA